MRRKKLKGKYTDIKVSSLSKFIKNNKLKLITISSFLIVLTAILLINSPKDNVFKSSYKKLLANNGIYTEEIKSIDITTDDYDEPGSFKVTKKADWTGKDTAELTIEFNSKIKVDDHNKDIVLVFDTSASMIGNKLDTAKSDIANLIEYMFNDETDKDNHLSIITFNTESQIVSPMTNNKEELLNSLDSITAEGRTNYNAGLSNVDTVLEEYGYAEKENTDLIVLFVVDGYPNVETPKEISTVRILKEKYPNLKINSVQLDLNNKNISEVSTISDAVFEADVDKLGSAVMDAAFDPDVYENLEITDIVDDTYFDIEDISKTKGETRLDDNKLIWNLDNTSTGSKEKVTIKIKVKDRYKDEESYFPTNKKISASYKLIDKDKETITTNDTPVLKNYYTVTYDTNAPTGCNIENVPSETHIIFNNVQEKTEELSCAGYHFKGWKLETNNVRKINHNTFIMPQNDVIYRATWAKQSIAKTMDGTVYTKPILYNVLKNEAKTGIYAKEYTGEHADAYDKSGTEKIYHYTTTSSNSTIANQQVEKILNKFNVIFGGFCWQMLRTTDTGGVKIIYNGVPSNGTCNNSGTAQQIGTKTFNSNVYSLAYIGYMYNKAYQGMTKEININLTESILSSSSLATTYWYANEVEWSTMKENNYNLDNPFKINNSDYSSLVGTFTFKNTSQAYTAPSIYYIAAVNGSTMYHITLSDGNNLDYYNDTYSYGDSYIDNEDGTYTISNPTTISRIDWYSNYKQIQNKYLCKNAINNTCNDLWYVTKTFTTNMLYIKVENTYKYAKGFIYENGKYKLNDETVSFWNMSDITNKLSLDNAHYTCWNTSGECTTLSYIYYLNESNSRITVNYLNLSNGKSIDDAINEMLYNDDVNVKDSTIKAMIDQWYQSNMLPYNRFLEDTVFCNERSIRTKNGWNPNGGSLTRDLILKGDIPINDLSCTNNNDRFSMINEKAKLTYPVGLASNSETNLLKNNNLRKTGQHYWLLTPARFRNSLAIENYITTSGTQETMRVNSAYGVRPVISLKPGIEYSDGDGSRNHPYIIDTEGD